MDSFATVIRTLLARIRDFQNGRCHHRWPPSGSAGATTTDRYRVPPTAWGVTPPEPASREPRDLTAGHGASAPDDRGPMLRGSSRPLELTVYGLPVPRGLPTT